MQIFNTGTASWTITYDNPNGASQTFVVLFLEDNNPSSDITFNQAGFALQSQNELIGAFGHATFNQSGGINTITTGGSNSMTDNLFLGFSGYGTYTLSDGSLTVAKVTIVGNDGTGVFTQSGGTQAIAGNLTLGSNSRSSGTYDLSGTGSLSTDTETIGNSGLGAFTQTGGTHASTAGIQLGFAAGSSGDYTITGGSLSAGAIQVNSGGTFNEQGGTVSGDLTNQGTFNYNGGSFADRLFNYGAVNFYANFTAGDGLANYGTITVNSGVTLTLNGSGLDNSDTLILAGGGLAGNGPLINNAFMSGYGTIAGSGGFTNVGFFTQSGGNLTLSNTGTNTNPGIFDLAAGKLFSLGAGATLGNQGTFRLNSAVVSGAGTLSNNFGGTISGEGVISSNFSNSGGLLLVENGLNISHAFSNSGTIRLDALSANLNGGAINNTGVIEGIGNLGNNITNTGFIQSQSNTLNLGGTITNNAGGQIVVFPNTTMILAQGLAANAGIINLQGGNLESINQPLNNTSGQIIGYGFLGVTSLSNGGTMGLSGGVSTVTGNVTNNVGGSINISGNPVTFTGNVTNDGLVKTTSTTVTFAGSFTNNGAYISDPAVQNFTDLNIGGNGYLVGGDGDQFNVSNNCINQSTQNALWNTVAAILQFTNGADTSHDLYIPGTDYGASGPGYTNNFAWGTLNIAGQNVHLFDGSNSNGGALYVKDIPGVTVSGLTATNIFGAAQVVNIYYDPTETANAYLNGLTYNFASGSGQLIPTPLPPSVLLLGSGLLGLGLLIRRRRKKI